MASTIPPLPTLPDVGPYLRNKDVIHLYSASKAYKHNGQVRILHSWVCQLGGLDVSSISVHSLFSKAHYLYMQLNRMKKWRNYDTMEFEEMQFKVPELKKLVINRKRHTSFDTGNDDNCCKCSEEIKKAKLSLKELQRNKRLSNQSLKRKQKTIDRLKEKYKISFQKRNKIPCARDNGNKVAKKVSADKSVYCNFVPKTHEEEIQALKSYISVLESEKSILMEDSEEKKKIETQTYERGRPFLSTIRHVCYDFLSAGVSSDNIPKLICSVINNLTDYCLSVEDLPSPSSINKMHPEVAHITRQHVADMIEGQDNIALMRDGTTKKGHHIYGIKIATEDNILTLGLREHASSSSETLFNVTKAIFHDIGKASDKDCDFIDNVFGSITSTMTDRCATELKLNKLLQEFKEKCLQNVVEDFNELCEDEKDSLLKINEFKCAVHPLLQFSVECEKVSKDIEKENGINLKIHATKGESFCQTLLRSVSKLLFKDGTGDPSLIQAFLLDAGVLKLPVLNFKGNRFNILFHNALGLFSIKDHIQSYLENTKSSLNFIQDTVLEGLKNSKLMQICRALGIVCTSITSHYWKFAAEKNVSAIEMAPVYDRLIFCLQKWENDVQPLLLGEECLVEGIKPKDGDSAFLFTNVPDKYFLAEILQKMCEAMLVKAKLLFRDFVEGGQFHQPSDEVMNLSKNCPQNNISLERLMAQADRSMTKCPNANLQTRESKIMYANNATTEWLQCKTPEEKEHIVKKAMKGKHEILEDEKVRKKDLKQEYLNILKIRQEEKKKKEAKANERRNKLMKNIMDHGYWMTEEEVDKNLLNKTKTQQMNLLKSQINGRKNILGQKVTDKTLFAFSKKGDKYTVDKLRLNLINLINLQVFDDIDNDEVTVDVDAIRKNPNTIVKRYIHHTWTDNDADKVWPGRIISYIPTRKMYKIAYWDDTADVNEEDVYEMTVKEILDDILQGTLKFI